MHFCHRGMIATKPKILLVLMTDLLCNIILANVFNLTG